MNNDQINQLAKEYAENKNKLFSDRISPTETWKEADIREFKQCADFLLRDHLIVEKSKVIELYDCYNQHIQASNKNGLHDAMVIAKGSIATMHDIFGETFNPTEK